MHSALSNITHIFGWFSFFTALWSTVTLFILVERKSPEAFSGYKNFLRIYCFYAFIFSIIDWLAQPSALVDIHGFGYVFYSENRLFDLGVYAGHFVLIAYCGCFIASSSFLSLNFIYRYVSICKPRHLIYFKGWRVILLFLYCAVPFGIWSLLVYTIMGPTPERAAHLNLTTILVEDVDLTGKPYVAVLCRHVANYSYHKYGEIEWGTMVAFLGLFGFQGFFYTVSLVCGFLTYNDTLNLFKKAQMSKELYKMQMQLLRAIVIQASVPLILVYIPPAIMILGGMSGIYVGQIGYFVVMSISIYPPIDSLVFLFSIHCYRSALCCEEVTVFANSTVPRSPSNNKVSPVELENL
ncbi:Protein CBG04823 [Caenorhabditis briggsae]|uniref:Protein CBG04823 n=1 Tax=Caenorhabditis briggsae TaxID=6238 RepID=A8WYK0_CAEBR|nr:Protein CBG04823 [Caenorhabditis briggsae]CAP25458.1 Protein CBG04823 [Caenorhabditis briggsae]